jgi:cell division GTPase FtsZ
VKPFIIGIGRAGCRIANLLLTKGYNGILADTEKSDLLFFPYRYKILLGEKILDGNGTGGDIDIGREVLELEKYNIIDRIDSIKDSMDCIFVISAMGGGTGGAVDILIDELKKSYMEPIYYAGVLPSVEDPSEILANFSDNLKRIAPMSHGFLPIDNDHIKGKMRLRGWYNHINSKISRYLLDLFKVGDYRSRDELGENVLGTTDVINTFKGISSIGIGLHEVKDEGFGFFRHTSSEDKPEIVIALTEKAVSNTLISVDISETRKALVVVYGPRKYLDFLGSIPARLWVEKNIGGVEVRGGDIPWSEKKDLEVMVLLSAIKKNDRLKYLYQLGKIQKNRDEYIDKITKLYDKLKNMESKFIEIEEDFKEIYEDLKKIEEPREESS